MYQLLLTIYTILLSNAVCQSFTNLNAFSSELAFDKSELAAASSSTPNPYQLYTEPVCVQRSVLNTKVSALENNLTPYLNSILETQIPGSVFTSYLSLGYSSLEAEYGASFTDQSWYTYIENVHTQVQNDVITIEAGILTLTSPASVASNSSSTIASTTSVGNAFTSTSSTLPSSTIPSVISTGSISPTTSSTNLNTSHTASRSRSLGLGLGLGLGFLSIILIGIAVFLVMRHRRTTARRGLTFESEKKDHSSERSRGELDGTSPLVELDGKARRPELEGNIQHCELESAPFAVELA